MGIRDGHEVERRIRDLDGDGEADSASELLKWGVGAVLIILVTFWTSAQFAALVHGFDWMPISKSAPAAPGAWFGTVTNPTDPASAWPEDLQSKAAPGWVFWPVAILFHLIVFRTVWKTWKWIRRRNQRKRDSTRWADDDDLKKLLVRRLRFGQKKRTIVGVTKRTHKKVGIDLETHILMMAGTGSGKTAGLCIPAMLDHEGTIIATSVKDDLVKNTIKYRQKQGKVFIFDPMDSLELPKGETHSWTPLGSSQTWSQAQETARSLIYSSKASQGGGNSEFWNSQGVATLPVLLYAAAVMNEDMGRVISWLARINDETTHADIDKILRWRAKFPGCEQEAMAALDAWIGFVTKEPQLRGNISATISSTLVSYEDIRVQKNAMTNDITPELLFDGGDNTLYIVAPVNDQERLEPIFVALIESMCSWILSRNEPLPRPAMLVIDEAANVASLPKLPTILSTIRSFNVQIVTAWQTASQIKKRYGPEGSNEVLGNSLCRMILPGIADPETISYVSSVTGETSVRSTSISRSEKDHGNRNVSVSEQRRALLGANTVRELEDEHAIMIYRNLPPAKIKMRMYFRDNDLFFKAKGKKIPFLYWNPAVVYLRENLWAPVDQVIFPMTKSILMKLFKKESDSDDKPKKPRPPKLSKKVTDDDDWEMPPIIEIDED